MVLGAGNGLRTAGFWPLPAKGSRACGPRVQWFVQISVDASVLLEGFQFPVQVPPALFEKVKKSENPLN